MNGRVLIALAAFGAGVLVGKPDMESALVTAQIVREADQAKEVNPETYWSLRQMSHPLPCVKQYIAQRSDPFQPWSFDCIDADLSKRRPE